MRDVALPKCRIEQLPQVVLPIKRANRQSTAGEVILKYRNHNFNFEVCGGHFWNRGKKWPSNSAVHFAVEKYKVKRRIWK